MAAGLGAVFLSALKKYLPFYKCSMQMSGQTLYALAGEGVQKALSMTDVAAEASTSTQVLGTADGWLCLLDAAGPRALLLTTRSLQEVQALLHPVGQGSVAEWEAVSMLAGHYPFRATDAEQFTPQELSYDRNGYVSFSKGCYTGQEIVARMHYRGKLKKQLYLITMDSRRDSFPDDVPVTFCSSDGAEIARSLTSRHLGDKTLALALLPVELADNTVNLCTSEGQTVHYSVFSRIANGPMVT
jgi:folate-binding protein YgfZ